MKEPEIIPSNRSTLFEITRQADTLIPYFLSCHEHRHCALPPSTTYVFSTFKFNFLKVKYSIRKFCFGVRLGLKFCIAT